MVLIRFPFLDLLSTAHYLIINRGHLELVRIIITLTLKVSSSKSVAPHMIQIHVGMKSIALNDVSIPSNDKKY